MGNCVSTSSAKALDGVTEFQKPTRKNSSVIRRENSLASNESESSGEDFLKALDEYRAELGLTNGDSSHEEHGERSIVKIKATEAVLEPENKGVGVEWKQEIPRRGADAVAGGGKKSSNGRAGSKIKGSDAKVRDGRRDAAELESSPQKDSAVIVSPTKDSYLFAVPLVASKDMPNLARTQTRDAVQMEGCNHFNLHINGSEAGEATRVEGTASGIGNRQAMAMAAGAAAVGAAVPRIQGAEASVKVGSDAERARDDAARRIGSRREATLIAGEARRMGRQGSGKPEGKTANDGSMGVKGPARRGREISRREHTDVSPPGQLPACIPLTPAGLTSKGSGLKEGVWTGRSKREGKMRMDRQTSMQVDSEILAAIVAETARPRARSAERPSRQLSSRAGSLKSNQKEGRRKIVHGELQPLSTSASKGAAMPASRQLARTHSSLLTVSPRTPTFPQLWVGIPKEGSLEEYCVEELADRITLQKKGTRGGDKGRPREMDALEAVKSPRRVDKRGVQSSLGPRNRELMGSSLGPWDRERMGSSLGPREKGSMKTGPGNRTPTMGSPRPQKQEPWRSNSVADGRRVATDPIVRGQRPSRGSLSLEDFEQMRSSPGRDGREPMRSSPGAEDKKPTRSSPGVEDREPMRGSPRGEDSVPMKSSSGAENREPMRSSPGADNREPMRSSPGAENREPTRSSPGVEDREPTRSSPGVEDSVPMKSSPGAENREPMRSSPGAENRELMGAEGSSPGLAMELGKETPEASSGESMANSRARVGGAVRKASLGSEEGGPIGLSPLLSPAAAQLPDSSTETTKEAAPLPDLHFTSTVMTAGMVLGAVLVTIESLKRVQSGEGGPTPRIGVGDGGRESSLAVAMGAASSGARPVPPDAVCATGREASMPASLGLESTVSSSSSPVEWDAVSSAERTAPSAPLVSGTGRSGGATAVALSLGTRKKVQEIDSQLWVEEGGTLAYEEGGGKGHGGLGSLTPREKEAVEEETNAPQLGTTTREVSDSETSASPSEGMEASQADGARPSGNDPVDGRSMSCSPTNGAVAVWADVGGGAGQVQPPPILRTGSGGLDRIEASELFDPEMLASFAEATVEEDAHEREGTEGEGAGEEMASMSDLEEEIEWDVEDMDVGGGQEEEEGEEESGVEDGEQWVVHEVDEDGDEVEDEDCFELEQSDYDEYEEEYEEEEEDEEEGENGEVVDWEVEYEEDERGEYLDGGVSPVPVNPTPAMRRKRLGRYEIRCPPGGEEEVVLYVTSLRGIRKTFADCNRARQVLQNLMLQFDERDISMHSEYRTELASILDGPAMVPQLFIRGHHIGGADVIVKLNEEGTLPELVEGIPRHTGTRRICDGCGGMKFIPCMECGGSHKLLYDDGSREDCPDCNENGLMRCPLCSSMHLRQNTL